MGEHVVDQLQNAAADDYQRLDAVGVGNGLGQVHQVDALEREQVALGNHAAQQTVFDDTDMGDMPFGHGDRGIESGGIRRQMERVLSHESGDRG